MSKAEYKKLCEQQQIDWEAELLAARQRRNKQMLVSKEIPTIDDVCKIADSEGISYGQCVAKYKLYGFKTAAQLERERGKRYE